MRKIYYLALLLLLASCAPSEFHHEHAVGHYTTDIEQCAIYARQKSGVRLYGDAGDWWHEAQGRYARGHRPMRGAVLVLRKTSHLRYGHVAVVKDVLNSRQINVTHSNWGNTSHTRHIIYDSMRVFDVSQANDWSLVRFWNDEKNVPGFPYAAYGFIYP